MGFLATVLPSLPPPDAAQAFPPIPAYFVMGLKEKRPIVLSCRDFEDVKTQTAWLVSRGFDAYYSRASFADESKGRRKDNAVSLRSFWADIDVGKKQNSYATKEEAALALIRFVKDTGLRPTYIVDSGNGFHVYWCLDEDISKAKWQRVAEWLCEVMAAKGMVFDPASMDCVHVLRLPGTIHTKTGRRVSIVQRGDVYSLEALVTKLYGVCPPSWAGKPLTVETKTPDNLVFDPFGPAMPSPPDAQAEPIVNGCRQMREASLGVEPAWYAMMSVLRRCTDGLEWAHRLSAEDTQRYDHADTEKKFYHAPADGPARCETFATHNPLACEGCPHRGQISSPVQLWRKLGRVEPVRTEPEKPAPVAFKYAPLQLPPVFEYVPQRFEGGGWYVTDTGMFYDEPYKDANGNWLTKRVCFTQSRLYYIKTLWTYERGRSVRQHLFRVVTPLGTTEDVLMDAATAANASTIMAWFYNVNIFPVSPQYGSKHFMAFMNAYLNAILNNGLLKEVPTTDTFGWREVQNGDGTQELGFATGLGIVTRDGIKATSYREGAEKLSQVLVCKGDLEQWKEVPRMYGTLDQKAAQLGVCLAFAAPLMKYGSGVATSATYSLWSAQSGMGKTQMLRACASIWGNPDEQWVQRQASEVARMRQMAVLNNLPVFMDELTNLSDEALYSLAYSLVGGVEKTKLKRNGLEMAKTGTWNTVTFCTSNKSIKEAVAHVSGDSAASIVRVIEYECDFASYADDPDRQAYINDCMAKCTENYGLAGPVFMHHLLNDTARLAGLTAQVESWVNSHGFTNAERFMAYPLALALTAGRWAVEWGLLDYDMGALEQWVLSIFVPHNRVRTTENSKRPKDVLLAYLMEHQRNMLMVETDDRAETDIPSPTNALTDTYVRIMPTHRDVFIRAAFAEKRLYISSHDLERWCRQVHFSKNNLLRGLEEAGIKSSLVMRDLCHGVATLKTPVAACHRFEADSVARLGFSFEGKQNSLIVNVASKTM